MTSRSKARSRPEPVCSIERCLQILSDRWSFLILREALIDGITRFADFQRSLGIAPRYSTRGSASLRANNNQSLALSSKAKWASEFRRLVGARCWATILF